MWCEHGIAHTLAETWRAWKDGLLIVAYLGDGSKISAVGRPHSWVCEVHSTRGVENRHSTEMVMWESCDQDGKPIPEPKGTS